MIYTYHLLSTLGLMSPLIETFKKVFLQCLFTELRVVRHFGTLTDLNY